MYTWVLSYSHADGGIFSNDQVLQYLSGGGILPSFREKNLSSLAMALTFDSVQDANNAIREHKKYIYLTKKVKIKSECEGSHSLYQNRKRKLNENFKSLTCYKWKTNQEIMCKIQLYKIDSKNYKLIPISE